MVDTLSALTSYCPICAGNVIIPHLLLQMSSFLRWHRQWHLPTWLCIYNYYLSCIYSGTLKLYSIHLLAWNLHSVNGLLKKSHVDVHPGGYRRQEFGDQEEEYKLWHSCLSALSESLFGPELICSNNVTWEVGPSSKLLFLEFSRETWMCAFVTKCASVCCFISSCSDSLTQGSDLFALDCPSSLKSVPVGPLYGA